MLRVLYVSNRTLTAGDHRLVYGELARACSITYALPGRPPGIGDSRYVGVRFGGGLSLSYAAELWGLFAFLRRQRREIDCVHLNSTLLVLVGPLLARLAGVPSVVTITGFGRVFSGQGRGAMLLQSAYLALLGLTGRLTCRIFMQNREDLALLRARLPALGHRLAYIGSGVAIPVAQGKSFAGTPLTVFLAGRLMPEKGIDDFLTVAERLRGDAFEFVLAGPPVPGTAALMARVRAAHDAGLVRYAGELDAAAVQRELARSHVFYFPSTYGEGMARVMLESGFAGLCPIAYDIPANRELLAEGRGFMVPKGDTLRVEELLRRLAADRGLLEANALAYQRHILRAYNVYAFAERMDAIWMGLACEIGRDAAPQVRPVPVGEGPTARDAPGRPGQKGRRDRR